MSGRLEIERYLESCQTEFWQGVFRAELDYLTRHLEGSADILSVGCGPAIIESGLSERGFRVTGLDVSRETLNCAPDQIRTVAARAEDMPFPESSFGAVIYIASLQFIENYRIAIEKTARVLRPDGKLIAMLLNPESEFFRDRIRNINSYVRKIRHKDIIKRAYAKLGLLLPKVEEIVPKENCMQARQDVQKACDALAMANPYEEPYASVKHMDQALSYLHHAINDLLQEKQAKLHSPADYEMHYDVVLPFKEDL